VLPNPFKLERFNLIGEAAHNTYDLPRSKSSGFLGPTNNLAIMLATTMNRIIALSDIGLHQPMRFLRWGQQVNRHRGFVRWEFSLRGVVTLCLLYTHPMLIPLDACLAFSEFDVVDVNDGFLVGTSEIGFQVLPSYEQTKRWLQREYTVVEDEIIPLESTLVWCANPWQRKQLHTCVLLNKEMYSKWISEAQFRVTASILVVRVAIALAIAAARVGGLAAANAAVVTLKMTAILAYNPARVYI
jgi:hypothetical protein